MTEQKPTQDELFRRNLPDTLYMSHYGLASSFPKEGYTPEEWRQYLRDNQTFIDSELAAIAESEARSALKRLSNATGTEVAALKAVLEKSKLINEAQRQNTRIVILHVPKTQPKEENHASHA